MKKTLLLLLAATLIALTLIGCEKSPAEEKPDIDDLLIISPAKIDEPADKMEDTALISLFENTLYYNASKLRGWILGELDLDYDSVFETNDDRLEYVLVKNISDMAAFKANFEAVFSNALLSKAVYPWVIEGDTPLFVENDGKLYFNKNTGGGVGFAADFTRANVTAKSENAFEIGVPMITADDSEGEIFIYKIVQQNGKWVLDSHHYFQ